MRNVLYVVVELGTGWVWQTYLPSGLAAVASTVRFSSYAEAERDARKFVGMTAT